jgi:hypothetical protein
VPLMAAAQRAAMAQQQAVLEMLAPGGHVAAAAATAPPVGPAALGLAAPAAGEAAAPVDWTDPRVVLALQGAPSATPAHAQGQPHAAHRSQPAGAAPSAAPLVPAAPSAAARAARAAATAAAALAPAAVTAEAAAAAASALERLHTGDDMQLGQSGRTFESLLGQLDSGPAGMSTDLKLGGLLEGGGGPLDTLLGVSSSNMQRALYGVNSGPGISGREAQELGSFGLGAAGLVGNGALGVSGMNIGTDDLLKADAAGHPGDAAATSSPYEESW